MRKIFLGILPVVFLLTACASAPPLALQGPPARPAPAAIVEPEMEMVLGGEMSTKEDLLPTSAKKAVGSWHAFALPRYNGRINGTVPEIRDLANDFAKSDTTYFRDNAARKVVVDIGMQIRSDLIANGADVAQLLGAVATNPEYVRLENCVNAVGGRLLEAAAIDDTGNIMWTSRECDPDETIIKIKARDGSWVPWFSVKCLNPLNGFWRQVTFRKVVVSPPSQQVTREESKSPPACTVWHPLPEGEVKKWGANVYLFLSAEERSCLPAGWSCPNQDCDDWMAGRRGTVPDEIHYKWKHEGGSAVQLKPGVAGVLMPEGSDPWYCNTKVHQGWEADPLPPG